MACARQCLAGVMLVMVWGLGTVHADGGDGGDGKQPAQAAERKAAVLERKASPADLSTTSAEVQPITKAEVQAVDPKGRQPLDDPLTCLARAIHWEARGEDEAAMEAVANVVMNRLAHPGFPNTVCAVVKQGGEDGSCEFSWWCDGLADSVEVGEPYRLAKDIARRALNGQLPDRTDGATYFHHERLTPGWSLDYTRTAKVGEHVFYRPPDGDAR